MGEKEARERGDSPPLSVIDRIDCVRLRARLSLPDPPSKFLSDEEGDVEDEEEGGDDEEEDDEDEDEDEDGGSEGDEEETGSF